MTEPTREELLRWCDFAITHNVLSIECTVPIARALRTRLLQEQDAKESKRRFIERSSDDASSGIKIPGPHLGEKDV